MYKDYKVFQDYNLEILKSSVNGALDQGWVPIGGISTTQALLNENYESDPKGKPVVLYAQAVAKPR